MFVSQPIVVSSVSVKQELDMLWATVWVYVFIARVLIYFLVKLLIAVLSLNPNVELSFIFDLSKTLGR